MAGLTLGGGYGPLDGRFGLALDNLVSADVVLADGRQVTASRTEDADLLWALRGSGGNFGVLTGARYLLHPLAIVLAGLLLYPLSNAAAVLNGSSAMLARAPDELSISVGFLGRPDGPVLFLFPTWSGEPPPASRCWQRCSGSARHCPHRSARCRMPVCSGSSTRRWSTAGTTG
jgi:FAD/FMN-containing dehydrogenase